MSLEGDKPESDTLRSETAFTAIERYGKIESNLEDQNMCKHLLNKHMLCESI